MRYYFSLLVFLILAIAPSRSHADFMGFLGVNNSIDRAVAGAQNLLDQARQMAFALEGRANEHAEMRLNQLNAIVQNATNQFVMLENKTTEDILKIIAGASQEIIFVEKLTMKDIAEMIDKAECAARRTLDESLREVLGDSIIFLRNDRITITPPVMYAGEQVCTFPSFGINCRQPTRDFQISNPFSVTYGHMREYLEARLVAGSRDDTPIRSIVGTYTLIADLARRASCYTDADKDFFMPST